MVHASMATSNKKEIATIGNSDPQFNYEVNMGKFPGLHRHAILIIVVILFVIFLWPSSENNKTPPQPSSSTQDLPVPIAPSVSDQITNEPSRLPNAQESLSAEQEADNTLPDETIPSNNENKDPTTTAPETSSQAWQTYTIKEGQTLAQLFRDNQLPVNDAFSMAKSEGTQQSLSQLRSGQTLRLQRSPQGDVSMLEMTNSTGGVITFTRLSDGSYYRTP